MISGAREARPSLLRRLVARAQAREFAAFVVPGAEVARAYGLDVEAAGLRLADTPRHANVLAVVGGSPEGLEQAAAVAYAQMPRPRVVVGIGTADVSPLPGPDVSVPLGQEKLADGLTELRRMLAEGAFAPETSDFDVEAIRTKTEYTCSMHPEVVQDEPGTCPICGMELVPRESAESADHTGMGSEETEDHGSHDDAEDGSSEHEAHTDHGSMGHDESGSMDHGDMDFMSMIEMTKDLPASSDGLQMEWVEDAAFGPLFPGLPAGLTLSLTLDGDTVAHAEAGSAVSGRFSEEVAGGTVGEFVGRLASLDPLCPISYRLLALRALENVAGRDVDEQEMLSRVGSLEKERAAGHLNWLASFAHLIGYAWLTKRSAQLQFAVLQAQNPEELRRIQSEVGKLAHRIERTPLLRLRLAGVGLLSEDSRVTGPVARAGGSFTDARSEEGIYQELGFEPVVETGGDALARLRLRLAEAHQSLHLARQVSATHPALSTLEADLSGTGNASVGTPRGAATLEVTLESGKVTAAGLQTPSTRHLGLIAEITEQRELADALIGVASLDLSPWEVTG